jgi:hypothetical protein
MKVNFKSSLFILIPTLLEPQNEEPQVNGVATEEDRTEDQVS